MRIIAFSDSHRHSSNVRKLFERTRLTTDLYIFLGDGEGDLDNLYELCPDKLVLQVAGNCDYYSVQPMVGVTEAANKKILFTHGHLHRVNFGIEVLENLAKENGASLVLFGHTHMRHMEYRDGIYYINPGSIGQPRDCYGPSYAAIDVIPAGILCTHCELD